MNDIAIQICLADTEFKIISLKHRSAKDILPTLKPFMHEDEMVSGSDYNLFVRANPDTLATIEHMLIALDVARQNLRITIKSNTSNNINQHDTFLSGSQSVGEVEINLPRKPNVQSTIKSNDQVTTRQSSGIHVGKTYGLGVEFDHRNMQQIQLNQQFVNVLDGGQSFIELGRLVPFTQRWIAITQRYISMQNVTDFREIVTGFAVRPHIVGENTTNAIPSRLVELEIMPRISSLNRFDTIDFQELSTTVRVNRGDWLDLGGIMQSRDEVSREIVNQSQNNGNYDSKVMIKVD